jgi:hypothetical protein
MKLKNLFLLLFLLIIFIPNIYSAELVNYNIKIDVINPTQAQVLEIWQIDYNSLEDLEQFKTNILKANLNLDKLQQVDSKLKPKVYINNFINVTVGFDDSENNVRIEYLNKNLLKNFISNDVYYIPKNSEITIKFYDFLSIEDSIPKGQIIDNSLRLSGVSSNELRILGYERKPPKPSFFLYGATNNSSFYYTVFILILLFIILLVFKEDFKRSIKRFVIKYSKITPEKKKNDIFDSEFFED